MTLFYTDLDRRDVDVREIPKMGRTPSIRTCCSSTG